VKILSIIRHAKSSWKDIAFDDFDRPLSKRGRDDALFMVNKLIELNIFPDLIVSSPAKRAKSTTNIIVPQIGYRKDIVYDQRVYESNMINLKKIVKNVDNKNDTLFLVGHNPGLNMLAEEFCGFLKNIATTGIVIIHFNCDDWGEISNKNSSFIDYIYPKKYKEYNK